MDAFTNPGVTYDDSPEAWNSAYYEGKWGKYVPGTAGISMEDWRLLFYTLEEIRYDGAVVFEFVPRPPLLTAKEARAFVEKHNSNFRPDS